MNKNRTNNDSHQGNGSIQYYTHEETRHMMNAQSDYDHNNSYTPDQAYKNYKKHRRHKIASWIGVIASLVTIIVGTITIIGLKQNNQPRPNNNTKVYESRASGSDNKPSTPQPQVKVKRVEEKPKQTDNEKEKLEQRTAQLQKETNSARQQAKHSAQVAKQEANSLKQQAQDGQLNSKMSDKLNDLEKKLNGYTQKPNTPQPYDNPNDKFPTGIKNFDNQ